MDKREKTDKPRHIVLIGLSGSGKSSLGRAAAQNLSLPFIDTDAEIERRLVMPISAIFEQHGEAFFRDAETAVIKEITSRKQPAVIATGGGAVLRRENADALGAYGLVIFLDRPPAHIIADVACDGSRPLVTNADALYAMSAERRPAYVAAAHITLHNDAGFDAALNSLLAVIEANGSHADFMVIGDPIAHTRSPDIHNAVFSALGIAARYGAERVSREQLVAFLTWIRGSGARGFNVTIPHKQDILPLLDEIADEARQCNAVNTVVVRNGRLFGYNTDMDGLLLSLQRVGYGYHGRTLMIVGAGGAASGVAHKAAREGAKEIVLVNRNRQKAENLADSVRAKGYAATITAAGMTHDAMSDAARRADVLIQATPLGMHGVAEDFADFSFLEKFRADALIYDLVYNPKQTQLLKRARALGLAVQNGIGMLIFQALLADELFLDRTLDKENLYNIAKGALEP